MLEQCSQLTYVVAKKCSNTGTLLGQPGKLLKALHDPRPGNQSTAMALQI